MCLSGQTTSSVQPCHFQGRQDTYFVIMLSKVKAESLALATALALATLMI